MTTCGKSEMIERALAFPLDKVIYRYRQETGISEAEARRHERELKRFLALSAAAERGYGMRGPIDKLWHTFILFTHIYENFCNKLGGGLIHHYPNVRGYDGPGAKPLTMGTRDYKRFLDDYRTTFGEAPAEPYWPAIPDPKTERFFAVDCSSDDCGNDCDGGTGGTGGDD